MILLKRGWKLSLLWVLVFSLGVVGAKAQSISVVTSVVPATNVKIADQVIYKVVVKNLSDSEIASLIVSTETNDGVNLVSSLIVDENTDKSDQGITFSNNRIGRLPANGTITLTCKGDIKENESLTAVCTATVKDASNNTIGSSRASVNIIQPHVSVSISADKVSANIGEQVTYETVITSDSKQSLTLVIGPNNVIKLSNPTLKAASNNTKVDQLKIGGGTISFPVGGGTVTLTYKGHIQSEGDGAGAVCRSSITGLSINKQDAEVSITINRPTPLSIHTNASSTAANIGEDVTYTTVIKGSGGPHQLLITSDGVSISSTIADNRSTGVLFTKIGNGGTITFPAGGGTITLTYNGKIGQKTSFIASCTATITKSPTMLSSAAQITINRRVHLSIKNEVSASDADDSRDRANHSILKYTTTVTNESPEPGWYSDDMPGIAIVDIQTDGVNIDLVNNIEAGFSYTSNKDLKATVQVTGKHQISISGLQKGEAITISYVGYIDRSDLKHRLISNQASIELPKPGYDKHWHEHNIKTEIRYEWRDRVSVEVRHSLGTLAKNSNRSATASVNFQKHINVGVNTTFEIIERAGTRNPPSDLHTNPDRRYKWERTAYDGDKVRYTTTVFNDGWNNTNVGLGSITLSIKQEGIDIETSEAILAKIKEQINALNNFLGNLTVDKTADSYVYVINYLPRSSSFSFTYTGTVKTTTNVKQATNTTKVEATPKSTDETNKNIPLENQKISTDKERDFYINVGSPAKTIIDVIKSAKLEITNTVDPPKKPVITRGSVTYTTTIINKGPLPVSNVLLELELDGVELDKQNVGGFIEDDKRKNGSKRYYTQSVWFLQSGKTEIIYKGIITSQSKDATNKATIVSLSEYNYFDNDAKDRTATATTIIQKAIDLEIKNSVTPQAKAQIHSTVNYTTVISNKGLNAVTGPHALTFTIVTKGVTINDAGITTHPDNKSVIITKNATLSIGDKWVYVITNFPASGLTLKYTGTINTEALPAATNNVYIEASGVDFIEKELSNNSSTATTLIIKKVDLSVKTTVAQPNPQLMGASLSYTTVISNVGPNTVTNATLTIEKNGVAIVPENFKVSRGIDADRLVQVKSDQSTPSRHVYTISSLPVGGTITLTYEGKILPNSHSAVNRSTIASPEDFYHDTDPTKNVSVAQTLIKPILTQPHSITICPEELINQTLVSDNPEVTSCTWASAPSTSTIRVYKSRVREKEGGHTIRDFIKNSKITGGTVVYTITPTIKAPIMPANGGKSVAYTSTLGEAKSFTVTIKSLAEAPGVLVAKPSIHYLESAVFTPSSSLSSTTYHWYRSADKHKPVRNGLINRDGVLTMPKLLPGTHTFYVAVLNPDRCEGAVASISVTVKSIPVVKPPSAFTPNGDGINDVWEIPKIEQYPHCTVHVWGREKGEESVYEARDGYHEPWDGTNKQGKPLTGTYWYRIDLKDGSEPIVGHVAIIR